MSEKIQKGMTTYKNQQYAYFFPQKKKRFAM